MKENFSEEQIEYYSNLLERINQKFKPVIDKLEKNRFIEKMILKNNFFLLNLLFFFKFFRVCISITICI